MIVFLTQMAVDAGLDVVFRLAERPCCPACRVRLPALRPPRTWRQFARGGRDCSACGSFYRMVGSTPVSFDGPPTTSTASGRAE